MIISYDINRTKASIKEETKDSMISFDDMGESKPLKETEEIVFTHFLSDYDPSLILLLTYNPN